MRLPHLRRPRGENRDIPVRSLFFFVPNGLQLRKFIFCILVDFFSLSSDNSPLPFSPSIFPIRLRRSQLRSQGTLSLNLLASDPPCLLPSPRSVVGSALIVDSGDPFYPSQMGPSSSLPSLFFSEWCPARLRSTFRSSQSCPVSRLD